MSAAELLKHLNRLTPAERRKFLASVAHLRKTKPRTKSSLKAPIHWPDVEARAKRIFGNRVLPNLVDLDRSESAA